MNVHIQRPKDTPLYTGLFEMIEDLKNNFEMKGKTMIEIGSYQGESTEVFSKLFDKIYAVDPWKNGYDLNDISSYATDMSLVENAFDKRMESYHGLIKIKDTSTNFFKNFNQIVDFVYIDGDHRCESIIEDLKLSSKIANYIGGHDWGMMGLEKALKEHYKIDNLHTLNVKIYKDSSWIICDKNL